MDAGFISLIGILVAMAFLIIASIKGLPILVVGPVSAVISLQRLTMKSCSPSNLWIVFSAQAFNSFTSL